MMTVTHRITRTLLLLALPAAAPSPNPWVGTWSLRAPAGEKPETLVYSDAGDGAMRMVSVEDRSEIVTRFDGRPAPDTGAGAATGPARTLAITADGPTRYRWTFGIAGKPFVAGVNTLAADGRSFTEVSWRVDTPQKRVTLVYDRR